jgi:ubiquinone/menaquinone biosynthesis C-methylase UbiE
MDSSQSTIIRAQLEREIDRYCLGFRSRRDYGAWRLSRVNQEQYQAGAIETLKLLFGSGVYARKILDAGAGMGGYVVGLKMKGFDCRGIDFNPDYVRISNLRASLFGLPDLVAQASVEKLPFSEAVFDIVHCHDVLEHCQNPDLALAEFFRVLKQDGVVLITFINRLAFIDPHFHLPFVNWMPRRIGAYLSETITKKDFSLNPDRQRLDEMNYYYFWQARKAVMRAGFKNISNVRSIKIKYVINRKFPKINGCSRGVFASIIASVYSLWEKFFGQNYYWFLSK